MIIILIICFICICFFVISYKKFNVDYEVDIKENYLSKEYYYYLDSEVLFLSQVEYDNDGVIFHKYNGIVGKIGNQYNPSYIAWFGLINVNKYLDSGDERYLSIAVKYSEWLVKNFNSNEKAWTYAFDKYEGTTFLKAPWKSAMAQGLAISLLTRTGKICNQKKFLEIANKALDVFDVNIKDGGVRTDKGGCVFFEEYPATPNTFVLDGFCFSLIGLYDLWKYTGNIRSLSLFNKGVECLNSNIVFWDYRGKWSWYGMHNYLCSAVYNKLNSCLVRIIGALSKNTKLVSLGQNWDPNNLNRTGKLEIFLFSKILLFIAIVKIILLKNIKRIKKICVG